MVHQILHAAIHEIISRPQFVLPNGNQAYQFTEDIENHYRESVFHKFTVSTTPVPGGYDEAIQGIQDQVYLAFRNQDINQLFDFSTPDENGIFCLKNYNEEDLLLETILNPVPYYQGGNHINYLPGHRIACNRHGDCLIMQFTDDNCIITFLEAGQQ